MKQAIYENQDGNTILLEEDSSPSSEKFAKHALEVSGAADLDNYGDLLQQVSVGARDLATSLFPADSRFQRTTIQVLGLLSSVLSEDAGFFTRDVQFPMGFTSFFNRMNLANRVVSSKLAVDWIKQVSNTVRENLTGLLDFDESNLKTYKNSRAHSFLKLIGLILSTQLRTVATRGIMSFLGIPQAS